MLDVTPTNHTVYHNGGIGARRPSLETISISLELLDLLLQILLVLFLLGLRCRIIHLRVLCAPSPSTLSQMVWKSSKPSLIFFRVVSTNANSQKKTRNQTLDFPVLTHSTTIDWSLSDSGAVIRTNKIEKCSLSKRKNARRGTRTLECEHITALT